MKKIAFEGFAKYIFPFALIHFNRGQILLCSGHPLISKAASQGALPSIFQESTSCQEERFNFQNTIQTIYI